ncbi:MAG: xanthine dehydrogenase family protein molybdopterin-binding subunit [Kordiimonadaceae bacterium]|nr:xanthine dehydrogenase family protein molybdopterin-binding subunit [Kordiimonadaceae bacterium]
MERMNRRRFLEISAAAGALILSTPNLGIAQDNTNDSFANLDTNLGLFLKINSDESIVIGYSVPEMGSGISTALPMIVAEELDVDFEKIKVDKLPPLLQKSDGRTPYKDAEYKQYSIFQETGGSNAIRLCYDMLRDAGAEARALILKAASDEFGVPVSELSTNRGYVIYDDQRLSYGSLAEKAASTKLDFEPRLKDPKDFKIIGTEQRQKATPEIVTGKQLYAMDIYMPGMLTAVIARCPYIDGIVKSYDDKEALKVPGVRHIIRINRIPEDRNAKKYVADGVAVIADNFWAAQKGREALKIEWDDSKFAHVDNAWIDRKFDEMLATGKTNIKIEHGDFDKAYEGADKKLEVTYDQPYWAHIIMENPCSVVSVEKNKVKAYAMSQVASKAMNELVKVLPGYNMEQIDITLMRMGTGFGRKDKVDSLLEAALCSKAVGKPVKVIWTREDDVEQDFFNPKGRHVLRGGLDKQGKIVAANYIHCTTNNDFATHAFPAHYIPNYRGENIYTTILPIGFWRAPTENVAGFALQSFVDEMAHLAGKDPLQFRIDMFNMSEGTPYPEQSMDHMVGKRFITVLEMAAKKAGWGKKLPKGHGMGVASFLTFGGYAATVVEVKVDNDGTLTIINTVATVDPGIVINRLGARAQIEGGTLDGFSAALGQEVNIEGGRVINTNLDSYEMARIASTPHNFTAEVTNNAYAPKGMGEMSLPPAIPALCNAIYDACGIRIRKLPIADQLSKAMRV